MPLPVGIQRSCYTENYLVTSLFGYWQYWNCKPECDEECLNEGYDQADCDQKAEDAMRAACNSDCRSNFVSFVDGAFVTPCEGTMCVDWSENIDILSGSEPLCEGANDIRDISFDVC